MTRLARLARFARCSLCRFGDRGKEEWYASLRSIKRLARISHFLPVLSWKRLRKVGSRETTTSFGYDTHNCEKACIDERSCDAALIRGGGGGGGDAKYKKSEMEKGNFARHSRTFFG